MAAVQRAASQCRRAFDESLDEIVRRSKKRETLQRKAIVKR